MATQYLNMQDPDMQARKRFDSVAMAGHHIMGRQQQQQQQQRQHQQQRYQQHDESDFTTSRTPTQQNINPNNVCESGRQRAQERPAGLPVDCWNSPMCPRNMPQNGGSARSGAVGQTICNPGANLNNHNQNHSSTNSTNNTASPSRNDTPTTEISIPVPATPPFDNTRPALKRVRTDPYDTVDTPTAEDTPAPKAAPKEKRLPHHVIERRYRENLNTQIEALRAAVPSTTSSCLSPDVEDIGPIYANAAATQAAANLAASNNGIRPLSKAGVIAHAAEYMRQLSAQNDEVEKRNAELRMTVEALRRLVNCEGCDVVQQILDVGS